MANLTSNPRRASKFIDLAFQKMQTARTARMRFMKHYVGRFFGHTKNGQSEDDKASPLNLIYYAATTYIPNLVFKDPEFKCTTKLLPARDYAETLALAVNHLTQDEIRLRLPLRACVADALFLAGFMKTGICDSGKTLELEGETMLLGKPFASRVDPDDMVIDPMARHWDEQYAVGNRYRVSKEYLLQSGMVDEETRQRLHQPLQRRLRQRG
jgi:hypothetical protein